MSYRHSHLLALSQRINIQPRVLQRLAACFAAHLVLCTILVSPNAVAAASSNVTSSSKRGLVSIETLTTQVTDDAKLTETGSDLTWYYNYGVTPTASLAKTNIEFVPMLWGSPGTGFASSVKAQIASGANITTVLGFNEPDGCTGGGACLGASTAAAIWIAQMEPLKAAGLKLGGPAITSSQTGLQWLAEFFTACNGACHPDFLPLHWYGDFQGMASWIGQVNATYLNNITDLWITEFAYSHQTLAASQTFYNQTIPYLDKLSYIGRYSYFGSFRSSVSNVGVNAAMLTATGALTDIGSWYLGMGATGNIPTAGSTSTTSSSSSTATSKSAAVGLSSSLSITAIVVGLVVLLLMT